MSSFRFKAVNEASKRKPKRVEASAKRPSEYFGELVFGRAQMEKYLSKRTFDALVESIDKGTPLSRELRLYLLRKRLEQTLLRLEADKDVYVVRSLRSEWSTKGCSPRHSSDSTIPT